MSTIVVKVPPYHLLGQIANLSAEAPGSAAPNGLSTAKIEETRSRYSTDPWRNSFRLNALAAGDKKGWDDLNGEVVWRNTRLAQTFAAQLMTGLGKGSSGCSVSRLESWAPHSRLATADDVNSPGSREAGIQREGCRQGRRGRATRRASLEYTNVQQECAAVVQTSDSGPGSGRYRTAQVTGVQKAKESKCGHEVGGVARMLQ